MGFRDLGGAGWSSRRALVGREAVDRGELVFCFVIFKLGAAANRLCNVETQAVRISEYTKGRKLEASDLETVEAITEEARKNGYLLNDMIRLIAERQLIHK
jgi:hypothetical protein